MCFPVLDEIYLFCYNLLFGWQNLELQETAFMALKQNSGTKGLRGGQYG
jgi:hypothetical protein